VRIDYERMKRTYPKHKAALTRASHVTNPVERYTRVLEACRAAVTEWDAVGAWPDGWSRWESVLRDAAHSAAMAGLVNVTSRLGDIC
jgi:hypothetical protein